MKILLIAPLEGPECTAWLISKALKNFGINVEHFSYREIARESGMGKMNSELNDKLRSLTWDDVAFIIKGELIELKTLLYLHTRKILWSFDFDSYEPRLPFINLARACNKVFLICYPWVENLREQGVNAFFMPQATDPSIYHPVEEDAEFISDVAFIGSSKPGRAEIINSLMKEFKVSVYGNGWGDGIKPVYLEDFNKVCNSAKILINITPSDAWPIFENTFSQRVYMTLAAGGVLINDEIKGIENFFDTKKSISTYKNIEDLKRKISFLLEHPQNRTTMKLSGREEILKKHTYYHRMKGILECLGLSPSVQKNTQE